MWYVYKTDHGTHEQNLLLLWSLLAVLLWWLQYRQRVHGLRPNRNLWESLLMRSVSLFPVMWSSCYQQALYCATTYWNTVWSHCWQRDLGLLCAFVLWVFVLPLIKLITKNHLSINCLTTGASRCHESLISEVLSYENILTHSSER